MCIRADELKTAKNYKDLLGMKTHELVVRDWEYSTLGGVLVASEAVLVSPENQPQDPERSVFMASDGVLQRQLDETSTGRNEIGRIRPIDTCAAGIGALGAAGIAEVTTGSLLVDGIAFSSGLLSILKLRQQARRKTAVREANDRQKPIYMHGEGLVLPHKNVAYFLQGERAERLFTARYDVDALGTQTTGREILDWLANLTTTNKLPLDFGDVITFPRQSAMSFRIDSSLYNLYLESYYGRRRQSGAIDRYDELDRLDGFSEQLPEYSKQLGITTQRRPIELAAYEEKRHTQDGPFKELIKRTGNRLIDSAQDIANKYMWKDADLTFICLSPGRFMTRMLETDPDPAELWTIVAPQLNELETTVATLQANQDRLKELDQVHDLTGVPSPLHETEATKLTREVEELKLVQLMQLIGIGAQVMVRTRKQRIFEQHEALLADMSGSYTARDLAGVLKLYDAAVTAIAAQEPARDVKDGSSHEVLRDYLLQAVKLADGTPETLRRLYMGMQTKLPHLEFPDIDLKSV